MFTQDDNPSRAVNLQAVLPAPRWNFHEQVLVRQIVIHSTTLFSTRHGIWAAAHACYSSPPQIRPTRPNQWLWHPLEWYEEGLLQAVEDFTSSSQWAPPARGCPLSVLEENVAVPPPLRRCMAMCSFVCVLVPLPGLPHSFLAVVVHGNLFLCLTTA